MQECEKKSRGKKLCNFLRDNVRAAARLEIAEMLSMNGKNHPLLVQLGKLCIDKSCGLDEGYELRRRAAAILLERAVELDPKSKPDVWRYLAEAHMKVWKMDGRYERTKKTKRGRIINARR